MSTIVRGLAVVFGIFVCTSASGQERRYFNSYMLRAYEVLSKDPDAKYDKNSYFTKDLDYGEEKNAIRAKRPPYTMCNAAVTETILDAINLYAADHPSWSPQAIIPASSWTTARWSLLMPHVFSHDYMGYPPLESLANAHIPIEPGLKLDIKNFQSEHGMSIALEKFGLGESFRFEDARPGDVISFDRDFSGGGASGHSAIFLAFLTRDQKEVRTYKAGQIVGFKYFSVQSSKPAGLGERWAYFKVPESDKSPIEMCPYSNDKQKPTDPKKSYCADAIDTAANRTRFPALKPGQPRDCCIVRYGPDGPRVGRLLMPGYWTYPAKQKQVAKEEAQLTDHVNEFIENLTRAGERLKLYANAALALEKQSPSVAAYIQQVRSKFDVDLRAIGATDAVPEIGHQKLHMISLITPASVIRKANEKVTTRLKAEMDERVRDKAAAQADLLRAPSDNGVPNPRLDGQSTD